MWWKPKIEISKDPESDSEEHSFFEGIGKQETLGEFDIDDALD